MYSALKRYIFRQQNKDFIRRDFLKMVKIIFQGVTRDTLVFNVPNFAVVRIMLNVTQLLGLVVASRAGLASFVTKV